MCCHSTFRSRFRKTRTHHKLRILDPATTLPFKHRIKRLTNQTLTSAEASASHEQPRRQLGKRHQQQ
ncbi:hypothetical protein HMPREF1861_00091 [Corynebacterium kroppenstedtii]|nr:hypothetical protein HMPREF1861_00091 [Corynebacterium kroppenstedtii]